MDADTKQLMQEVSRQLAEGNKVRDAVQQIEEQLKHLPKTIDAKIDAVRRVSWDPVGNYRGVMQNESDARAFGLYCMAQVGGDLRARDALKADFLDVYQRAMGTDTTAAGGGLVPIEFSARIQRLVEEYGVWAANAFPMDMTSDSLTFQRRVTGTTVFKTGQGAAVTESQPTFETINLNAEDWHVLTLYPKALGEDAAASIGELIALEIAQSFAQRIDDSGFVGDGTPSALDVLGLTERLTSINGVDEGGGLILGTGSGGAKWGSLVLDDLLKLKGIAPTYASRKGRWYCSSNFFWTVMAKFIFSQGGSTSAEIEGVRTLQFLGDKVEITASMPGTGADSQVACLYGDLRLSSTHGRRKDLTIDQSSDVKFIERQVAVLGTQRHAINNHSLGDATTAGAIVGLITPVA